MKHTELDEEELMDALFWAELHGIRDVEIRTIREWLERDGRRIVPHPADDALPGELHSLLDRLGSIYVFVHSTDHLSDRELYEFLIDEDRLGAHMAVLPHNCVHIDVIGSGSEEDNEIYLRYYATENERQDWKEGFPEYILPPHEDPPYDRDRSLPGGL